ncbi:MAG: hypothetical protein D6800_08980, partial [Candidatus Zixiibacteriota bacterium]
MDIFEYAMKMEEDGRNFYIEQAEKAEVPELKKLLLELADDEAKHYRIFKAMKEGHTPEHEASSQTKILATVKNIFETMKEENKDYTFPSNARDAWVHAREIEKKAEDFYREKAGEVDNDTQKDILLRIADEEHRHWV